MSKIATGARQEAYSGISQPNPIKERDRISSTKPEVTAPRINGTTIPLRRLLGSYYTPDDVANLLARWALGDTAGNVLDPSFGGCAFLEAAATVLRENGCKNPGRYVFGIDVDSSCASYVRESLSLFEDNCVFNDFLALRPSDVPGAPFQAILGNPPYVRHHWLKQERRVLARRIAAESKLRLPETASLWAYFVLHALAFLRPGGRLCMLVPEAILQADYAVAVRSTLEQSFERVRLIHVRQRLFEGTDEPVVVIAGEGFGTSGELSVHSVESVMELNTLLQGHLGAHSGETLPNGRRINADALGVLRNIERLPHVVRFGDLAETHIGIVTGANSHFVRTKDDLRELGVPTQARVPIVSRSSWLKGLEFTLDDHRSVAEAGMRAFLVRPKSSNSHAPGVERWIQEGISAGVHEHHKCSMRNPWHRVNLPATPDAFVTSTRQGSPRVVLNRGKLQCTNTLYAASWNPERVPVPEVLALGFLTTFVALWSEVNGRRYGGGVLKLDLNTLSRLPLPIVSDSAAVFQQVDEALRRGDEARAQAIADEAVLCRGLGISSSEIELMRSALIELTRQRTAKGRES